LKLIIDIGNTRIKTAVFEKKELRHSFIFDSTDQLLSADLIKKYSITRSIVCSVVNDIEPFIEQLKKQTSVLLFSSETPTPLKNLYRSAQTLGSDRLAAAVGGNSLFFGQNVLVIDAGTCIKYNFINSNNEYIGGAISPGLKMRFKALHTFTSRLPLLKADENFDTLVGTNSNESILSGVEIGSIAEIEGVIERYELQYKGIKLLLTGGDANFFEKRLKKSIFADQNLILKGLNEILEYNNK
jgi:type III pantothenate kinase